MSHPTTLSGGLHGPFTHWHPTGALESHGRYIEDGSTSVPDGVWGFWYPDGTRRSVGRYERGQPVGCFVMWDEQGGEVTGIVEGEQLRVERCDPPSDEELKVVEARSHPPATRAPWGDVALHAVATGGALGVHNPTQRDRDPASRATFQLPFASNSDASASDLVWAYGSRTATHGATPRARWWGSAFRFPIRVWVPRLRSSWAFSTST